MALITIYAASWNDGVKWSQIIFSAFLKLIQLLPSFAICDSQVILRQVFEATEEALATPQRSPRPHHTGPYPALPMLPYPSLAAGSASGTGHADSNAGSGSETTQQQQPGSGHGLSAQMSPTRLEHLSRRSLAAGQAPDTGSWRT